MQLKDLFDQRLIDEADYRARRDKALGGLYTGRWMSSFGDVLTLPS